MKYKTDPYQTVGINGTIVLEPVQHILAQIQ